MFAQTQNSKSCRVYLEDSHGKEHIMPLKIAVLMLFSTFASASDLPDPTRPPDSHLKSPEPSEVATTTPLKLSFTRLSGDGAFARINGVSVYEGDSVAGRLVESIEHGRVVLRGDERCVMTMVENIKGGGERLPPCRAAARVEPEVASSQPEPRQANPIQVQSTSDSAIKSYCARIFDSYRLRESCIQRERGSRAEYNSLSVSDRVRSYCNRVFDSWSLRVDCAQRESEAKARLGG